MHATPTYSSWINQVERFFAFITADLLVRSDHRSMQALKKDIRACGESLERPQAPPLDQDRRRDPDLTRKTSSTNYRRRTLEAAVQPESCRHGDESGRQLGHAEVGHRGPLSTTIRPCLRPSEPGNVIAHTPLVRGTNGVRTHYG